MAWEDPEGKGKGELGWDRESLQRRMSPDALAGAEGWMASLNLRWATEMQAVFPVHAAFCLCCGGIIPLRRSFSSQTLQQLVSERLHCLQHSQGCSQVTLALRWLLISLFPCRAFWALAFKAPSGLVFPR